MTFLFKKKNKFLRKNRNFYKPKASFSSKKRGFARFLKKPAIAGFVFLIVYFIFFSQFFVIKKIRIEGNKNIPSADMEKVINDKLSRPIIKFIPGNNFFLAKNEEIERALLSEFYEIKSVKADKKLPHSLNIKITEKDPLVIWCRLDSCYYTDGDGIAFLSAEKELPAEKDKIFIKVIEQLKIEEEIEDESANKTGDKNAEKEKKNDVTYKLTGEQFEKVRLFFVGEEKSDWVATYPVLFAIAGEDMGLPALSELPDKYAGYSLGFAKKMIDDLKRIEVRDGEKIFYIRINFNYENETIFVNIIEEKEAEETSVIFEPIKINEAVSDSDFINFAINADREIKNNTTLNIKYYKTKGTKTRELIAYTDKNTRIYFNTNDEASAQADYLKNFLLKGVDEKKIDSLKYIYLKSGNKIFYK